ncbi:photosystem I reaction center subunit PsaK [Prochlorococcus sp. MIT 1341]|uniref:photosystem I reaction center subunit PsaK n=1 Tax=Prochlorococcus sp. MIT 1341 TaxID=3096221 RepID=UPI002A76252E|nr:photosystem I reaction center subunit PsaK [Prochlorococcus sp. MIT 1341]
MMTNLLAAAAAAPATFSWSPKVAVVMIACNVLAYAIARANIAQPNEGFQIPNSQYFGGMSHASVVAANCLGHVLGIGTILGLASRGVL